MKTWEKIGCLAIVMLSLLIGGMGIYQHFTYSLPEKKFVKVWLPPNAEIYPREVVRPGTFKVIIPLAEFKTSTKDQKVIVVYRTKKGKGINEHRGPLMEYWRPSEKGIFHYAQQKIPLPEDSLLNNLTKWEISFSSQPTRIGQKGRFIYTPIRHSFSHLLFLCFIMILGLGGAFFLRRCCRRFSKNSKRD